MPDSMLVAMAGHYQIRAVAAFTTGLAEEARRRHQTSPTASAALGKALTAGLLLSAAGMKGVGRLTIRVMGDGPLGPILVDAGADGTVRGYLAHPEVHLAPTERGTLDVGGAVGRHGTLSVTHDTGRGHPYTGTVQLVSGELGEDFAHYMAHSMQIPSALSLGIFIGPTGEVESAGGLLVQLLPGAGDEVAWRLEQTVQQLPSFTQLMHQVDSLEEVLAAALEGFAVEILGTDSRIRFECPCSTERVLRVIASLGEAEIRSMIEEDGQAEVRCHFCNQVYLISRDQLLQLVEC